MWSFAVGFFDPLILGYLTPLASWPARLAVISFALFVNLFWLYGIYHLVFTLCSWRLHRLPLARPPTTDGSPPPRVALLYLTMNDFSEEALGSCLSQSYPAFDVYVLDDSTSAEAGQAIDRFVASAGEERVQVIRRPSRSGFKAGNLNHALRRMAERYPLFAICDADGVIPTDFLSRLVPYFRLSPTIGFVQANQHVNPSQKQRFARDFGFLTDVHGDYYPVTKNRFGFLMFYGHGGIVRMDLWKTLGGFPEILSEDLAFTSLLRERGYVGLFVPDVVCYEDLPATYPQYLRRQERWIKGTTEYLLRYFPRLARRKNVAWFEKLDILLSATVLLNAAPFLIFLLVVGVLLPWTATQMHLHIPLVVHPFGSLLEEMQAYRLGMRRYTGWTLPFFLMMTVTGCSQLLAVGLYAWRKPLRTLRCMAEFTFIALATVPVYTIHFVTYLMTRRGAFLATGDVRTSDPGRHDRILRLLPWIDSTLAVLFAAVFTRTANPWLLTVASALALHPWLIRFYRNEWGQAGFDGFIYIPFALVLVVLLLIGSSFL